MRGVEAVHGGICVVGAVGIIAGGIAGTGAGLRADLVEAAAEGHYTHRECGPEKAKYFDKKAMKTVSLRSNVLAVIELRDGKLTAEVSGFSSAQDTISVPRANPVTFIFRNFDDAELRMVASLGTAMAATAAGDDEDKSHSDKSAKHETCTQLIPQGAEQGLTITYNKPSIAQEQPFTLSVPGVDGQSIKVLVP
ncbi:MAG: hypothetical protein ACKOJG_00330 [Actinomycetota bacterium]